MSGRKKISFIGKDKQGLEECGGEGCQGMFFTEVSQLSLEVLNEGLHAGSGKC